MVSLNHTNLNTYNFDLPDELIAQTAIEPRDHSKLLIYKISSGEIFHDKFYNIIDYLPPKSLLVFNDSKVIPARLNFKAENKEVEILLTNQISENKWEALVRPGKIFKKDATISLPNNIKAKICNINEDGSRIIEFSPKIDSTYLNEYGKLPLPPYIKSEYNKEVADRYQTIYANKSGSIAAPTAGLHFTPQLLEKINQQYNSTNVTLNVGLGTFTPIRTDDITEHQMHTETYTITKQSAEKLNTAKINNIKIIAVGTTSARTLESQMQLSNKFSAGDFQTNIFISPGYKFKAIDGLITNFHLPKSSLFILISSLIGIDSAKKIYQEAIDKKYRFYSFGDACLLIQ